MPTDDTTRRPPSVYLLDHGSIGFQCMKSAIDDRWVEVIIEDDEVEVTIVTTPAKMSAIGLSIAGMVANYDTEASDRVDAVLDRIEQAVAAVTERLGDL